STSSTTSTTSTTSSTTSTSLPASTTTLSPVPITTSPARPTTTGKVAAEGGTTTDPQPGLGATEVTGSGELPRTGSDAWPLAFAGCALLGAGVLLVARRSPRS